MMMAQPVALDHVFLVLMVVVWPVAEYFYFYPRAVRGIKSGVTGARAGLYVYLLVALWGFTACLAGLWVARGRSWDLLRLGAGPPIRLGIGLTIAALFFALLWAQRRAVLGRPERLKMVRQKLANAEPFMPQTLSEFRMLAAVSVSAGFCEEILFRGFVMWYAAAWFPVAGWAPLRPWW
jgi:CAAX protease family protein